jgi:hypothetical protein
MPNKDQHIKKAKHIEEFSDSLIELNNKFIDWAIVAYFYSALHWVDALLAEKLKKHPENHRERENYFRLVDVLRDIFTEYKQLKLESETVRYKLHKFEKSHIKYSAKYYKKIKEKISQRL